MKHSNLPRLLQPFARFVARHDMLHPYLWKYLVRLREHFATRRPAVELETTFQGNIRVRTLLSDHIEAQLFWQGFQEADQGVLQRIRAHLPRDGVFIDVGANIGSFTLVGARVAEVGHVHAFEPSGHHHARLSHNVALNGFTNVTLNQQGLHDQPGSATLFLPRAEGEVNNSGAASLYRDAARDGKQVVEEVALIRLDDYVADKGVSRVDVIKIDIEGAEYSALKGAMNTLRRFRPLVLMELDRDNLLRAGCTADDILGFWQALGFQVARIDNHGDATPIHSEADLGPHQNLLCQPDQT